MKITLSKQDSDFHLIAKNQEGNEINLDASTNIGGQNKGMRPMQLLLAGLGACSSIDVLLVLKKQKINIDAFDVEVESELETVGQASLFKDITIHYKVKSDAQFEKVERAVKLSLEKYCSVAKTLESTAKINYKISLI